MLVFIHSTQNIFCSNYRPLPIYNFKLTFPFACFTVLSLLDNCSFFISTWSTLLKCFFQTWVNTLNLAFLVIKNRLRDNTSHLDWNYLWSRWWKWPRRGWSGLRYWNFCPVTQTQIYGWRRSNVVIMSSFYHCAFLAFGLTKCNFYFMSHAKNNFPLVNRLCSFLLRCWSIDVTL